ncbi:MULTISPECIES: GntR family transcriptional regulator [unclassified Erwinia]|uniref:GntR family transcriptional regulator n=1 Tax=unclassified Erwinia TaxID=2622719 RepID=UPI0006FD3172|nr:MULTISPECIES: GntR family transcriptional regulator [unclassified Erwinia]KQN64108.1 GntR family transcriptional regulator [Erwinia sp. Leaf53]PLV57807.1 GntR family transcriptional regulator [Erwinia sp. B116]
MKKRDFITQDLLSKIYQAAPGPLHKLPGERELAEEYGVSRHTVRAALKKLVSIGIIRVVQGSGIFVSENARSNPLVYNSITEKRFDQMRYRLLSLHKRLPDKDQQQVFGIGENEWLWYFCRLRYVDERCTQIETSSLPLSRFPDLTQQVTESSLQQYVTARGDTLSHFLTHYQAVAVDKAQAALLGCRRGAPAMKITNRGILAGGDVWILSEVIDIHYECTWVAPFNADNLRFRRGD